MRHRVVERSPHAVQMEHLRRAVVPTAAAVMRAEDLAAVPEAVATCAFPSLDGRCYSGRPVVYLKS